MDVFDLVAKISLDTSSYENGLNNAQTSARTFGSKLKSGLATAAKVGATAITAVTTATAAMSTALLKGVADTASYGDNIDKMSQQLGMSTTAYQEWDAILQHSGASIESMQSAMKTLAVAAENGSEAFTKLGMSQEEVAQMSQEELFDATIRALQNVTDETERTTLASKLLGRGGTELGALLNTSAEDVDAMRQRVHELGGVMSEEAVKAAAAYQDSLQDMKTAFTGLSRGLTSEFMPSITTVMNGLTEIFSGNSDSGIAMVSDGIDQLVSGMTDKLPEIVNVAFDILDALLNAIIDNLPKLLEMGGQLVGKLIAGLVAKLPDIIASAPKIVVAIIKGLTAAWPSIKKAGADLIGVLKDGIVSVAEKARDWGSQLVDDIKAGLSSRWSSLVSAASSHLDDLRNAFFDKFENVKKLVGDAIDWLKNLFNFKWELPHISLPHFSWSWNDLGIIKIPSISVAWYKKAYETPYMFSKPTVMGFGDGAGDEMVYGKNNLMNDIRNAVKDVVPQNAELPPILITVQSVLDGKVIGETSYKYMRGLERVYG